MPLINSFPILTPDMTLEQQVKTVNDIRLGMFTRELSPTQLNGELDNLLPGLTEAELNTFMQNLSTAYGKVKIWCENNRRRSIKLEVSEKEALKLQQAENKRKRQTTEKTEKSIKNAAKTVNEAINYDSDAATNKAIKEMMKLTNGSYTQAVAMLMSIQALPKDYKMLEGVS